MTPIRLLPLWFTAVAAAQTVAVFPFDHVAREGSFAESRVPLSNGITRAQLIYSRFRLGIPNGAQIRRVGFRPDVAGTGAGRSIQLEVFMGHAAATTLNNTVSTTFASNYVGPAVNVYTAKTFVLPTVPAIAAGPNPNPIWIPLDTPFTYDSTQNLVVEYRVTANNNGNAAFNYGLDRAGGVASAATFGSGCQTSGRTTPTLTGTAALVSTNWALTLNGAPTSSPGVLLVGVSNTSFAGIPLPRGLADLGAPTCSLLVSPDVVLPFTTVGSGLNVNLPVPNVPPLASRTFHAQTAIADLFANSLGLVTSSGCSTTLGVAPQAAAVVATGSATAQSGSRTNNLGLVSLFEY